MKTIYLLFVLFVFNSFLLSAQGTFYNETPEFLKGNSVWAFAKRAGLNFNSGTAVPIQTAIQGGHGEGNASVADRNTGELLFYSNGADCWDANHRIMPNGRGLFGNGNYNFISTHQGVCIVPMIDNPDKYYLFSMCDAGRVTAEGSLFYSVVDMTLNNGLGDIVAGQKNIPLDKTSL